MKFNVPILVILLFIFSCTPVKKQDIGTKDPDIRILLNEIDSKDSLTFKGVFKLRSEEAEYVFGKNNQSLYIIPSKEGILFYNENRYLEYRHTNVINFKADSPNSQFIYGKKEYSGDLIIRHNEDSTVYLINELSLEEYLRSVVPSEIPSGDIKNFQAIKAQTICARTYALNKIKMRKNSDYDVYSDQRDQVYSGSSVHQNLADRAVSESRGIILTYEGNPATVYYHSTCGGKLEAAENIFGKTPISYLAGGSDAVSDLYSCSASPKFRWQETRTIDQLDSIFNYFYNKSCLDNNIVETTEIQMEISIIDRTNSGRIKQLKINYADTTVSLENFEIRRVLGWPIGESLYSTLFYIDQPNDSTISLYGGGYGHGVGMCQWGALNMSAKGFKYYHILNKYFPGTLLSKGY